MKEVFLLATLKILIDKSHLEQIRELSGEFNDVNFMYFYIDSNVLDFDLKDYDILLLFNPTCYAPDEKGYTGLFNDAEKKAIQNFVKKGGWVIFSTGFPVEDNPNREDTLEFLRNLLNIKKIMDGIIFGIDEKDYKGSKKNIVCIPTGEEYCTDLKHIFAYESNLFIPDEKTHVIMKGPKTVSFQSEKKLFENIHRPPIVVKNKIGKGMVIGISSTQMFLPITKNKTVPTNNKQFLFNIFNEILKIKEKKELDAL